MVRRAAMLAILLGACSSSRCSTSPKPRPAEAAPLPPPSVPEGLVARYEVELAGEVLHVVARVAPGTGGRFTAGDAVAPYVDVEGAERHGNAWEVPGCKQGCSLRYTVRLGEAGEEVDDIDEAVRAPGGMMVASPAGWILAPAESGEIEIAVKGPFATAMEPRGDGVYRTKLDGMWWAPPSAFGPLEVEPITLNGGTLTVAIGQGPLGLPRATYRAWVERRARIVTGYLGKFPVPRALLVIVPYPRRWEDFGKTFGAGGAAAIVMTAGEDDTEQVLADDWVLVHELLHLSHPNLDQRHHWLEEGIATYAESIARARAGDIPVERAWRELAVGLPKGLPGPGDRGLDRTPTWGRTYWGGALFCFTADVEIRRQTHNARGFEHALRGINDAGGNIYAHWSIEDMLRAGDRATGVEVLLPLYQRLANTPDEIDILALFKDLGVRATRREAEFDDAAPSAAIRRALTAPRS